MPQRQMLVISARISSSLGCGFAFNNAAAAITMPGMQNPHWLTFSARNAAWIGWLRSCDSPSIVVTKAPSIDPIETKQDFLGLPSISTMHAPHCPVPQPYLVPVRFDASRSAHSSGVAGSMRYSTGWLLTVNLVTAWGLSGNGAFPPAGLLPGAGATISSA